DTPITIAGSVRLPGGEWDAWVLSDVGPREHDHLRGRLVMSVDGTDAGGADAVADDITVAMMEVEPHFGWTRLGRAVRGRGGGDGSVALSIVGKPGAGGIFAEVDAIAFSPADPP